jgi:hypothetical protein
MFFAIPNLVSSSVFQVPTPWSFPVQLPPLADKAAWQAFCADAATKHCFFSGVEGLAGDVRVSRTQENDPFALHGLVADYDGSYSQDSLFAAAVEEAKAKPPCPFKPAYVGRTFSRHVRAVWLFERPLLLSTAGHTKELLKEIVRELKLSKWFAGFDEAAFLDPNHYYEVGSEWVPVAPDLSISKAETQMWAARAARNQRFGDLTAIEVPMDKLAEEAEARWPGRWRGEFTLGKQGVRFWDPQADNDRAAVIHKDGMLCFTGGKAFVPWREIFGAAWVNQFEADRISKVRSIAVCDENEDFWLLRDGVWCKRSTRAFSQELRCAGFSSKVGKNDTASEIDRVEKDIRDNCSVTKALPFVHMPHGPLVYLGKKYLNVATARCLPPAEGHKTPEADFPWLWAFLQGYFEPADQLWPFLAWLRHFYKNGVAQEPKPGQAVIIAGPTGKGKNFLSNGVVGTMAGGFSDASSFLVEGSQWTDEEATQPLMTIDDQLASSDPRMHMRFSALLKKVVANRTMNFNGKWKARGQVSWLGRVIVTCNLDPESLRILPNLELSLLDKLSLFKAGPSVTVLPGFEAQQAILRRELPAFCRWLIDWQVPAELISEDPRFGVRPYHHPELTRASNQATASHMLLEILLDFLDDYQDGHAEETQWIGSVAQLHTEMAALSPGLMSRYTPQQLGSSLGLFVSRGLALTKREIRGRNQWVIPLKLGEMQSHDGQPLPSADAAGDRGAGSAEA